MSRGRPQGRGFLVLLLGAVGLVLVLQAQPAGGQGTLPPCTGACKTQWTNMIQAVAKTKRYSQVLTRLQIAVSKAKLDSAAYQQPITLFLPSDKVFASNKKYRTAWTNRRCATPQDPYLCYIPLCLFMMAPGLWTPDLLMRKPYGTKIFTLHGNNLEKFTGGTRKYRLGPETGCLFSCARKVDAANLVEPNIFVTSRVIVHGIDKLLAPPSTFPDGFN